MTVKDVSVRASPARARLHYYSRAKTEHEWRTESFLGFARSLEDCETLAEQMHML